MKRVSHMFTLGYEGLDIDAFVACVQRAGVKTVVDVREVPISRKKGFSKTSLRERLAESGIGYSHFSSLGCPKAVRSAYKSNGDWSAYTREFLTHLALQGASLRQLQTLATAVPTCLVCFEADYLLCHRTYVARTVRELGGPPVLHLTEMAALPDLTFLHAAQVGRLR